MVALHSANGQHSSMLLPIEDELYYLRHADFFVQKMHGIHFLSAIKFDVDG